MQISVVLPTYKREKDLSLCLNSILVQTKSPKEVLVVDNGNDINTANLIKKRKKEFEEKGIILKYVKNELENSLTVAKNLGVRLSCSELISFLDDDLVLDKNYYKEVLAVFNAIPCALGVGGFNQNALSTNSKKSNGLAPLAKLFRRAFYISAEEHGRIRVLPSLCTTYPTYINGITPSEWLSGASTYKRGVLVEVKSDENLKKYSWNEDLDLSYRIFKKYPNTLFISPHAKYFHEGSKEGRLSNKERIYMTEVYALYLFYKNMDQNLKNKLIYSWSEIGRLIYNILLAVRAKRTIEFNTRLDAIFLCIKHRKDIKNGDLTFFNTQILHENSQINKHEKR